MDCEKIRVPKEELAKVHIREPKIMTPERQRARLRPMLGIPDAILIRKGATALDLAAKIHTDIAKGMLYAIDARSKRRLGREYVLNDCDVIKIVSAAK